VGGTARRASIPAPRLHVARRLANAPRARSRRARCAPFLARPRRVREDLLLPGGCGGALSRRGRIGHALGFGHRRRTTVGARDALVGPLIQDARGLVELASDGEVADDAFQLFADPALECLGIDFDLALGAQRAVAQTTLEGPLDDFTIHNTRSIKHAFVPV